MSITLATIGAFLGKGLAIAGGMTIAKTVTNAISGITSRILPYEKSGEAKKMAYQASINRQQQELSQQLQMQMKERGFKDQKELAYMQAMLTRQTTFLANIQNNQNAIRTKMFDDALRHFPLNIPPLVMLQNAGIPINNLTDELYKDDSLLIGVMNELQDKTLSEEAFYTRFKSNMQSNPVGLSVFVTPLQIDARVAAKDKIAAMVWDNVYQDIESLFIKEYNRSGERPVIFCPGAWNVNAKPGLHASEILYFFTKGMPVIVLEPRFDGRKLRLMFSCWGVGMMTDSHVRQEIDFDMDWNTFILQSVYERSKDGLNKLEKLADMPLPLAEIKKRLEHNIVMCEALITAGDIRVENLYDDINKLFYLTNSDFAPLSNVISNSLGMVLSVVSDVHHLMSRGIEPRFPLIKDKYFGNILSLLESSERKQLNSVFNEVFDMSLKVLNENNEFINVDVKEIETNILHTMSSNGPSILDQLKSAQVKN